MYVWMPRRDETTMNQVSKARCTVCILCTLPHTQNPKPKTQKRKAHLFFLVLFSPNTNNKGRIDRLISFLFFSKSPTKSPTKRYTKTRCIRTDTEIDKMHQNSIGESQEGCIETERESSVAFHAIANLLCSAMNLSIYLFIYRFVYPSFRPSVRGRG